MSDRHLSFWLSQVNTLKNDELKHLNLLLSYPFTEQPCDTAKAFFNVHFIQAIILANKDEDIDQQSISIYLFTLFHLPEYYLQQGLIALKLDCNCNTKSTTLDELNFSITLLSKFAKEDNLNISLAAFLFLTLTPQKTLMPVKRSKETLKLVAHFFGVKSLRGQMEHYSSSFQYLYHYTLFSDENDPNLNVIGHIFSDIDHIIIMEAMALELNRQEAFSYYSESSYLSQGMEVLAMKLLHPNKNKAISYKKEHYREGVCRFLSLIPSPEDHFYNPLALIVRTMNNRSQDRVAIHSLFELNHAIGQLDIKEACNYLQIKHCNKMFVAQMIKTLLSIKRITPSELLPHIEQASIKAIILEEMI